MSVCHSGDLPLKGLDLCLPSPIPPSQRMEIGLLDLANKNIECSVQFGFPINKFLVYLSDYTIHLHLKSIHCLFEIQVELGVLYFVW